MKKFNANKSGFIRILLLASLALPVIVLLSGGGTISENPITIVLTLIPFILFLWIYFGTYYIVENEKFFYRSAFLRGHVDIIKIREIIKGKTTFIGIKPATASKGLLIKFNTYDEIYVSPDDNDSLIKALKEINNKIRVVE